MFDGCHTAGAWIVMVDMSTTMTPRIDLLHHARGPVSAIIRAEERIELDPTVKSLVKLRASVLNGCAYCIDMHWTHAREEGETEMRLAQLAAWHESPFFTARERAALALTDAVTAVGETHVPDAVWNEAAEHFEEGELAHLLVQIAMINAWNRIAVSTRVVAASYDGQEQPAAA